MHPYIILLLLGAVAAAAIWYRSLPASRSAQARNRLLLYGGLGLLAVLLVTGRLSPLFAALGALVPVVLRLVAMAQAAKAFKTFRRPGPGSAQPGPGQTSNVETRFLRMSLDHESGTLDGVVLEGPLKGRRLGELELESLLNLLATCRAEDAKSAAVLEAYLERMHGDAWRDAGHAGEEDYARGSRRPETMGIEEARQILNVEAGATREEIIRAHRSLIQKMHPDRGGSTFLAAKINQAKKTLLDAERKG